MPCASASALASANPLSATNDLTIAHVMWGYADAGFVEMRKASDRNKPFVMPDHLSFHARDEAGLSRTRSPETFGVSGCEGSRAAAVEFYAGSWRSRSLRRYALR